MVMRYLEEQRVWIPEQRIGPSFIKGQPGYNPQPKSLHLYDGNIEDRCIVCRLPAYSDVHIWAAEALVVELHARNNGWDYRPFGKRYPKQIELSIKQGWLLAVGSFAFCILLIVGSLFL